MALCVRGWARCRLSGYHRQFAGWVTRCRPGDEDQMRNLTQDEKNDSDWCLSFDRYNQRKDKDAMRCDSMASCIAMRRMQRPDMETKWSSYAEHAEILMPADCSGPIAGSPR